MKNFLNLDENPLKNFDPILRFDKLILNEKRVKEMHEYSKDPEFFRFMEIKPSETINETKDYLEKLIARDADGSHGGDSIYWAIIDQLEDKMIGTIGFQAIKRSHVSGLKVGKTGLEKAFEKEKVKGQTLSDWLKDKPDDYIRRISLKDGGTPGFKDRSLQPTPKKGIMDRAIEIANVRSTLTPYDNAIIDELVSGMLDKLGGKKK